MGYNSDPTELLEALADMRTYWREAELSALYGLSTAETGHGPMPVKVRRRADIVIARNLARAAERSTELTKWLEAGFGPADLIRELLARIARTETSWRRMLAVVRATAVVPQEYVPRHAIETPADLHFWLERLAEWAKPESEIIADLSFSIANQDARSDEALDHVQWSAEDDIEAINAVLLRSREWPLGAETRAFLATASDAARAQLTALIALVDAARPFSLQMRTARFLADLELGQGRKPH